MDTNAFAPLTERDIERSLWYLEHRAMLRKVLLVLLFVVNSAFLVVVLVGIVQDLMFIGQRRMMFSELVATPVVRATEAPAPLTLGAVTTLVVGDRVDLVLPVENANAEFTAIVRYAVSDAGGERVWEDVVPPATRTTLVALALPRTATSLSFAVRDVAWRRTRAHIEGRYADWKTRVGSLHIEKTERLPAVGRDGVHIVFTLKNNTAFHLAQIPLVVLLWRGETLVAVNRVVAEYLPSGGARIIDIRWMDSVGPFQTITVEPHVDLLNPENRYVPSS